MFLTCPSCTHLARFFAQFLLRVIAVSSYAPGSGGGMRPHDADATLLYRCLRAMFEHADAFGGSLFALAASVITDLLHHEPTIYRTLDAAGLPQAFISAVKVRGHGGLKVWTHGDREG